VSVAPHILAPRNCLAPKSRHGIRGRLSRTEITAVARAKSLKFQVPLAGADKPHLGRVGMIAATGFVLGIVWPWLAGVTLVPKPPQEELASVAEKAPSEKAKPKKGPAASKPKPVKQTASAKPVKELKRVTVGKPTFTSCRDDQGRTVSACDPIPIDDLVVPRIEAIQGCPAAKDAQGTLSLGMKVDFESNKVTRYLRGKSTSLPDTVAKSLIECAKKELAATSFAKVPHNHRDYTVFYLVEIVPPHEAVSDDEARNAKADDDVTPASGMATVAWVAARVRAAPSKESDEVARLASGARVKVVGKQGDWYKVRWDAKGSEGWVFKSAIGM
jgi:hypothetical protein